MLLPSALKASRWRAILLAVLAVLFPARLAPAKVENLALFIGVDEGLAQDRLLKYASRDAIRMAQVIRELGPFDKNRIYVLSNPTLETVVSNLEEIGRRIRELRKSGVQTMFFLYYSGHGSADGLHVRGRRFGRDEVIATLESLESTLKIVVLDACESGDFLRRKGGQILPDREIVRQDNLKSNGTIILSSSSRGEVAQESEDYKGAVFSHHFINGLRGLADYNADGKVSLHEAFDYARASTRMEEIRGQAGRQNPSFDFDVVGESDFVLASLGRMRSRILLKGMPSASLDVYNAQSLELEHQMWLTGKDSAFVYLPSAKFILRYAEKDELRVKSVDLTWTPEFAVGPTDFRRQGRSHVSPKGGLPETPDVHSLQMTLRKSGAVLEKPLVGAEYVFRTFAMKQSLGLSFGLGLSASPDGALQVNSTVYRLGYSLRKPLLTFAYAQVLAGLDAALLRVEQEVRDNRYGSSPPMVEGRPALTRWSSGSNMLEAGAPLELEIYFPWRIWLGLSASGTLYRYREGASGRIGYHWFLEPGFSVGRQF